MRSYWTLAITYLLGTMVLSDRLNSTPGLSRIRTERAPHYCSSSAPANLHDGQIPWEPHRIQAMSGLEVLISIALAAAGLDVNTFAAVGAHGKDKKAVSRGSC